MNRLSRLRASDLINFLRSTRYTADPQAAEAGVGERP